MASVSEQLLAALDDLDTDELKRFKWRIKNYYGVSAADLKKADAPDTVDLMMKRFGPEEAVTITVDILRKMNQNHLAEELEKKHKQDQAESSKEYPAFVGAQSKPINVTFTNIDLWTRNDFLQYSHQLTPDLNTANNYICLSESSRVITATGEVQPYPDNPDRFNECQVLCRESVCGRCYWEIEWSGGDGLFISVSYKSISRKGDADCLFGSNDQSWSLICCLNRYLFMHNNIVTDLSGKPISSRIGVYVDHSEGTLSFYSVSDTMSLIRTVQTTFTQPLYPGFRFYSTGSSVKLC